MVKEKVQTDAFLKAFILTIIVFLLGIFVGYLLEANTLSSVKEDYSNLEIDLTDLDLQSTYYQLSTSSPEFCSAALESNLKFADESYEFGLKLDRLEQTNKLDIPLINDKKKYVLSKLRFWFNSIQLKKECGFDYHTVVYFYSQFPDPKTKAKQNTQSAVLSELKEKHGNNIMLIPMAMDLDLASVNTIVDQYGIDSVPAVIIDESVVLLGVQSAEDIENYIS